MVCTLVTAQAADYRKAQEKVYLVTDQVAVMAVDLNFSVHSLKPVDLGFHTDFIFPENPFLFTGHVKYIDPGNQRKPDNRSLNGILNKKREQERISIGLNL